jgi:dienelactone hydrolase
MQTGPLTLTLSISLFLSPLAATSTMAQSTSSPAWQRWLEAAPAVPEFQPPATLKTWSKQREQIRAELWQLLGKLPPRPKTPAVQTLSRVDRGDFFLERFQFDNGAGDVVPGYLLLPKTAAKKSPAILYCHWHGGQYDVGKEELFRTNATPVPAGPALAKRGFVVLAVDACCFGERNGRGPSGANEKGGAGEMSASKFNLWVGRTLWGMMLRDDLIALDYLCSRPEVDAARIGVTGISMGATRTWWLMALDERLKAGVAICCLTRYQNLIATESLRAHGIYYFVPGLLNHFDTEAVVALAAPRSLLFQSGETDASSPVTGIQAIESKVSKIYQLHGAPKNFQSLIYPGVGHVYTPEMWEKTLAWWETHLMSN